MASNLYFTTRNLREAWHFSRVSRNNCIGNPAVACCERDRTAPVSEAIKTQKGALLTHYAENRTGEGAQHNLALQDPIIRLARKL